MVDYQLFIHVLRRKRAVGSDEVVTVDFNPRNKNVPLSKVT